MAQIDTLTNVGAVVSTDLALILRGGANVLGTFGSLVGQNATSVTITGGTINGTVIGGTTAAAGSFTTGQFNTSLNVDGTATMDGLTVSNGTNTTAIPATSDRVSFTAVSSFIQSTGALFVQPAGDLVLNGTGAEIMRLKSGKVGIGTSSPTGLLHLSSSAPTLYMTDTTNNTESVISMDNAGSLIFNADLNNEAGSSNIRFNVDGAEAMRIDSAGNVGIGVTPENSTGTWRNFEVGGANLSHRSSGANDAMLGTGFVFKTDNSEVYKNSEAVSRLFFNNNVMSFQQAVSGTAGNVISWTTAATIDASGNLLVGKTTTAFGTAGIALRGTVADFTRNEGTPINVNRLTSDGSLIDLHKDGVVVGSIRSRAGAVSTIILDPRAGGRGLGAGSSSIVATDQNGTLSNGATDIGEQNFKFRNAYLSGGVYLGGTGAANLLDDYEEGTFLPTFTINGVTAVGSSYTTQTGVYRKVGNVVYYIIDISATIATTVGSFVSVSGLPFNSADAAINPYPTATFRDCSSLTVDSGNILQPWVNAGTNYIRVQQSSLTTGVTTGLSVWDSLGRFNISGFYFTS